MELKVKQDFDWAHEHVRIVSYKAGDTIDTEDEDLIRVAREEGWVETDADDKPATRAKKAAPDNKDAGAAPENK